MQRAARKLRTNWNYPAVIQDLARDLDRPCILSYFSNDGGQITGVLACTVPNEFILKISRHDYRRSRVIWRNNVSVGVEFTGVAADPDGFHA